MNKIKKVVGIFLFVLILGLLSLTIYNIKNDKREYKQTFQYFDQKITIHLYQQSTKHAHQVMDKIEKKYKEYESLINRYQNNNNIHNVYYILYNNSKEDTISIEPKLYKMLEYAKKWYQKSEGKIDVSMASVEEIWKMYRDSMTGFPTPQELKKARIHTMDDIVLLENNRIKNNHVDVNLDIIAKGLLQEEIQIMLKKENVFQYLIDINGDAFMGDKIQNQPYKIALQNPENEQDIYQIIKASKTSVVTTSISQNYYEYQGIRYHHIIDPKTFMPSDKVKSVSVITSHTKDSYILSKLLFLMGVEEGKKYIEREKDAVAIFYVDSNTIVKSKGFSKYE